MKFIVFMVLLLVGVGISGVYGALHDQLSFTVSPEYFTEFKFHQFELLESTLSNRVKAGYIGFLASWWMGVPIAFLVGLFGFLHKTPRLMFKTSLEAFVLVLVFTFLIGIGGLCYGYYFASSNPYDYPRWYLPDTVEDFRAYISVGHMHNFGYLGGVVSIFFGIVYQCFVWFQLKGVNKPE